MIGLKIEMAVIAVWLGFLFFFSLIESALTHSSALVLKMMVERPDKPAYPMLPVVLENKTQILIPLHFGIQLSAITVTILTTHLCLRAWAINGIIYSFVAVILISVLFRQLLPRLLTQNEPEKKLAKLLRVYKPLHTILRPLALPLAGVLNLYKKLHEEVNNNHKTEGEEATDEEIQAYLEIGEDEGIIEEEDSELIQSVVEFGDTLVREVMTPRTKIIACDEKATIAELREAMVQCRHSRIPIYRGDIDHIIGIAYIRQLMAEYAKGRESDSIEGLVNPALFVPGTKPVSKLLKELQQRGDHAAVVIDEFGGVAGLVTIEDLVEEIVGEIWDEDEAQVNKIVEENPGNFVVHGSTELFRLEELTGRKFGDLNCSTAAGLVIAFLGRVPAPGEAFEMDGARVKILDADRKRVHWIRIQLQDVSNKNSPRTDGE
jgi:CBS domain containing-hemolysin-like protein